MPCASNINAFVTGTVPYTDTFTHNFAVLDLAKWVSYQSYLSPYYGALPISIVLGQWGFEMGWSLTEFAARNNPGNMDSTCGYSGSIIPGVSTPGKRYKFDNLIEGVTAYAHLLIAGYPCVQSAYSHGGIATAAGLTKACNALSAGYDADNTTSSSYCANSTYAENSSSTKRIWATAGYSGLYITINGTNNTCINGYNYIQSSDPGLYKFTNISF
ncbi:hypothetical protein D3C73_1107670 [compost metagenome]